MFAIANFQLTLYRLHVATYIQTVAIYVTIYSYVAIGIGVHCSYIYCNACLYLYLLRRLRIESDVKLHKTTQFNYLLTIWERQ